MMMAHDSTSDSPALEPDTLSALEEALQRLLSAPASVDDIEPALRRIAMEARGKRMHAEQLLIVLKDVWYGLPAVTQQQDVSGQNAILQKLVSSCIRAYYTV